MIEEGPNAAPDGVDIRFCQAIEVLFVGRSDVMVDVMLQEKRFERRAGVLPGAVRDQYLWP